MINSRVVASCEDGRLPFYSLFTLFPLFLPSSKCFRPHHSRPLFGVAQPRGTRCLQLHVGWPWPSSPMGSHHSPIPLFRCFPRFSLTIAPSISSSCSSLSCLWLSPLRLFVPWLPFLCPLVSLWIKQTSTAPSGCMMAPLAGSCTQMAHISTQ